jgi:adenylate kinase
MNFTVSQETSIARQLKRGLDAIAHNKLVEASGPGAKIPVRETDLNEATAEFRYKTYEDKMRDCVMILREMPEYHEISTEGDMESVRNEIYRILSRS